MEKVETDMHVYCSDSYLLKKLQRLVFAKDENGVSKFTMNQLLPLPSGFSGIPNYQIFGHHWRELLWGVKHDGEEFHKNISENIFDVHFTTPWIPAIEWFKTFCQMSELLYRDCEIYPEPEFVVFLAFGIFDTSHQGFSHWEPGKKIVIEPRFPEESGEKISNLFGFDWTFFRSEVWK